MSTVILHVEVDACLVLMCRLHHTWNHWGQGGHQLGRGNLGEPQAFCPWGLPFRGHVRVLFPSHGDRASYGVVMTSDSVRVTDSIFLSTSGDFARSGQCL
ncbi:unnamed protein product [Rangifer tarandus platyrhynchus]|uniref:Uncharacterized protein n=1 Tax=Rangifer tarandus platyrhynchus TaxID=3082113 RepID=A0AC60A587_RANTA